MLWSACQVKMPRNESSGQSVLHDFGLLPKCDQWTPERAALNCVPQADSEGEDDENLMLDVNRSEDCTECLRFMPFTYKHMSFLSYLRIHSSPS